MKQKYLTILLTILMSMAGVRTFAYDIEVKNAEGVTIYYNYKYTDNGTRLVVTCRGSFSSADSDDYSGRVVIPESVVYNGITYRVAAIGDYAFAGCRGLTEVIIPNGIGSIGKFAFYECI